MPLNFKQLLTVVCYPYPPVCYGGYETPPGSLIRVPEQITEDHRMVTNLIFNKLQSENYKIYTI